VVDELSDNEEEAEEDEAKNIRSLHCSILVADIEEQNPVTMLK